MEDRKQLIIQDLYSDPIILNDDKIVTERDNIRYCVTMKYLFDGPTDLINEEGITLCEKGDILMKVIDKWFVLNKDTFDMFTEFVKKTIEERNKKSEDCECSATFVNR